MSDSSSDSPYRVHLILEGYEEECFFDIVKQFGVSPNIELTYENAYGFGNVASLYQNAFIQDEYDCVLCVYDVDYRQSEKDSPYNTVVGQLTLVLGKKTSVMAISFCTNPNILQMLLLGCDDFEKVKLTSGSKKGNTKIVHKYWDKIGRTDGKKQKPCYDAQGWQLDIIKNSFLYDEQPSYSYDSLLLRCSSVPTNYLLEEPGTNIPLLLNSLKEGKISFFESINKKIK